MNRGEQFDNLSNADTKGMRGGGHKKWRKVDEQREKDAQLDTKGLRGCKDNTSKDPFSQCEQLQGIHTQVKSEHV